MVQIVDQFGRPIEKQVLKTQQTVSTADISRIYPDHPSRGLNIRKLPRILQQAEQGNLTAQACLFADMEERDGHLFAEMEKRKNVLLTLDNSIEPPPNASAREKKLADAMAVWIGGIPNLEDIILNGMTAVGYGFSCQEIKWDLIEKEWLPELLMLRPHYWFNTAPEDNDKILLDDGSYRNGQSGSELWPFGWLVHRHNARSGFIGSSGLFRVLVWPYLFKNFALRDLAEFLEIYGLPARIAYYAQGTSDDDRDRILNALIRLGHEAVAALPQGNEIKFESAASGGSEPFMAMIDWAEKTVSKAILGATLTTQADGKTSTNALGNIHNEVRHDLMVADARQIQGMFNQLIYMLAQLNGYSDINPRRLPKFVFDVHEEIDLPAFADGVATLVNDVGMPDIPVSWVRKKTGIPVPKDGEPVLTPRQIISPAALSHSLKQAALNTTETEEDDDPAMITLEDAPLPVEQINAAMSQLLTPMVAALTAGQSADEAMNIIAASYPQLDDDALRELLTRAFFVADLWGQLNANS